MDVSESALLDQFGKHLHERAECGPFECEDVIRYTFFHSLITLGYPHYAISLEFPLPHHDGYRIDTLVHNRQFEREMAVEFKYHRVKNATQPQPQLAGSLYRDLYRLAFTQATFGGRAYLIYVTDSGMARYLSQARHKNQELFTLLEGCSIEINATTLVKRGKTFLAALGIFNSYPAIVRCAYRREFRSGQQLIVFAIEHIPDPIYKYD